MKKKQILSLMIVAAILGVLVYLQFRAWQTFDWAKFREYTGDVSPWHITAAIVLIYVAYVLRAVRWAIFLRPTAPTRIKPLIAPQIIGFAALGLFGRAGEFARPYLIARKQRLTFTSQLAVWTVERVFDMGAVLLLMAGYLGWKGGRLAEEIQLGVRRGLSAASHNAGYKALFVIIGVGVVVVLVLLLKKASGRIAEQMRARLHAFQRGFHTIHDVTSFLQLVAVSVVMWLIIAGAYIEVLHAYPPIPVTHPHDPPGVTRIARTDSMRLEDMLVVMGSSMLGSVVQLPGGVGGSQLAVIGVLQSNLFNGEPYNITPELAVSCGIMLWLVTFMAVIPAGLLLARYEKISFTRLSEESTQQEKEWEAAEARAGTEQSG